MNQFNRYIEPYFRRIAQFIFLFLIILIGTKFIFFVHFLENGIEPVFDRPPGVEAFLPISALISLKYFILTGVVNKIHPSGLVLLIVILTISILLKKGFCSWVCPFSLLSELLLKIHKQIFHRYVKISKYFDYPLRSLKYLLLLFFLYAIFWLMDEMKLERFIYSPYNQVADIKMLKYFSDISKTTAITLILLVILSTLIPFFWCRYLCPYGALLGFLSIASPFKIRRDVSRCINCKKCNIVCPSRIDVMNSKTIYSDECHACFDCINSCPVHDTLFFSMSKKYGKLSYKFYGILVLLIFIFGFTLANILGIWENSITKEEYLYHIKNINSKSYMHDRMESFR